jgi:hypothetical protein
MEKEEHTKNTQSREHKSANEEFISNGEEKERGENNQKPTHREVVKRTKKLRKWKHETTAEVNHTEVREEDTSKQVINLK